MRLLAKNYFFRNRIFYVESYPCALHVGKVRTALFNLLVVKRGQLDDPEDAAFVLRLEELDYAGVPREQFNS